MKGALAATSGSGQQRAQGARQEEFYTSCLSHMTVAHDEMRHKPSPFHREQQPAASSPSRRSPLRCWSCCKPRPPNPTHTMASPFAFTGKHPLDLDLPDLQGDGTRDL